jgi:hypothetical protein
MHDQRNAGAVVIPLRRSHAQADEIRAREARDLQEIGQMMRERGHALPTSIGADLARWGSELEIAGAARAV